MRRIGKIVVDIFENCEQIVKMTGEIGPNDLAYLDYNISMAYRDYIAELREKELDKISKMKDIVVKSGKEEVVHE